MNLEKVANTEIYRVWRAVKYLIDKSSLSGFYATKDEAKKHCDHDYDPVEVLLVRLLNSFYNLSEFPVTVYDDNHEREIALAKLTPREKELLGIKNEP